MEDSIGTKSLVTLPSRPATEISRKTEFPPRGAMWEVLSKDGPGGWHRLQDRKASQVLPAYSPMSTPREAEVVVQDPNMSRCIQ